MKTLIAFVIIAVALCGCAREIASDTALEVNMGTGPCMYIVKVDNARVGCVATGSWADDMGWLDADPLTVYRAATSKQAALMVREAHVRRKDDSR